MNNWNRLNTKKSKKIWNFTLFCSTHHLTVREAVKNKKKCKEFWKICHYFQLIKEGIWGREGKFPLIFYLFYFDGSPYLSDNFSQGAGPQDEQRGGHWETSNRADSPGPSLGPPAYYDVTNCCLKYKFSDSRSFYKNQLQCINLLSGLKREFFQEIIRKQKDR